MFDHPVVQRAVILELQRAERVRDAFERVGDRMRVVVGRIDAPRVAGAVMRGVPDPVQRRVPHVHVRRRHVDLRAQHVRAVGELARPHAREQVEVLCDRPIAIGTVAARFGQRAAVVANLVGRQAVDVGLARRESAAPRTGTAPRSSRTRRTSDRPSRTRASGRPPGSSRRTRRLPSWDWCRRTAGCRGRRNRRRRRSSGRSTWRGRCAGSRSAPAESACARGRRACPVR